MFNSFLFKFISTILIFCFFTINLLFAEDNSKTLYEVKFGFEGIFGKLDISSARRGLQIYMEVCAGCHSLKYVAYRNLSSLGYNEEEIKKIASEYEVEDGPDEQGDMFIRNAIPSDRFINPYENDNIAKVMNNGVVPPDLSLIVKARSDGAKYLYSLLLGYEKEPDGFDTLNGYYNKFYPGNIIAMPQPLYGGDVEYLDSTEASLEQEAKDLVTFLMWTSNPEMADRKKMGFRVFLFLSLMTILLFLSYRKIWRPVKEGKL